MKEGAILQIQVADDKLVYVKCNIVRETDDGFKKVDTADVKISKDDEKWLTEAWARWRKDIKL